MSKTPAKIFSQLKRVRNDLFMLSRIYNSDTALKFDDYWKVFKGPRSYPSAAKQFLRTNFIWTKSGKLEE